MIRKFGSLKHAIFFLLALAVFSAIGTFIPQQEEPDFYKIYFGRFAPLFIKLNITDMYHSILYRGILILLGLNLLLCVYERFRNLQKKPNFIKSALCIVHLAVLVIFTGGAISGIFKINKYITVEENKAVVLPVNGASLKLDKFTIDYYPDGATPKTFKSLITLIDKNLKKEIKVNHPLNIAGIKLYQSGYEIRAKALLKYKSDQFNSLASKPVRGARSLTRGDSTDIGAALLEAQETVGFNKTAWKFKYLNFIPDFALSNNREVFSRSMQFRNPAIQIGIYKGDELKYRQWLFAGRGYNSLNFSDTDLKINIELIKLEPYFASVFLMVKDPGYPVVALGFLLLAIGATLTFVLPVTDTAVKQERKTT